LSFSPALRLSRLGVFYFNKTRAFFASQKTGLSAPIFFAAGGKKGFPLQSVRDCAAIPSAPHGLS
jgi:hypothetical protein